VDQNHYSFTVLKDDGPVGQKYGVQGIPTTVIIGRDGIVRNVFVGFGDGSAEQIDAAIKQALDQPATKSPA
jgi:protein-disulfide isomerase